MAIANWENYCNRLLLFLWPKNKKKSIFKKLQCRKLRKRLYSTLTLILTKLLVYFLGVESVDSHRQTELRICEYETNHNMDPRFLCSILHFVTWKSVHSFCWGKLRINSTLCFFYDDIYFHFSLTVIFYLFLPF